MLSNIFALIFLSVNPVISDFNDFTDSLSNGTMKDLCVKTVYRLKTGEDRVRIGKFTAYCSKCDPSGITRSGKRLRRGLVAADPRYWHIGHATIWVYKPRSKVDKFFSPWKVLKDIEDTGGAIKGRHRFDICYGFVDRCICNRFGVRKIQYIKVNGEK